MRLYYLSFKNKIQIMIIHTRIFYFEFITSNDFFLSSNFPIIIFWRTLITPTPSLLAPPHLFSQRVPIQVRACYFACYGKICGMGVSIVLQRNTVFFNFFFPLSAGFACHKFELNINVIRKKLYCVMYINDLVSFLLA